MAMLPKKGDEFDLKNWRLITLLGVDYKLIARALARLAMPFFFSGGGSDLWGGGAVGSMEPPVDEGCTLLGRREEPSPGAGESRLGKSFPTG